MKCRDLFRSIDIGIMSVRAMAKKHPVTVTASGDTEEGPFPGFSFRCPLMCIHFQSVLTRKSVPVSPSTKFKPTGDHETQEDGSIEHKGHSGCSEVDL